MSQLLDNFHAVRRQIMQSAQQWGRDPNSVQLLAVSKTFPAADIQEIWESGLQECFGENRVQELSEKAPVLPPAIQWHLIGQLQRNKVRAALKFASWIHSVDSVELFQRIQSIAQEEGKAPKLLLEVNVSGEASKSGFAPQDILPFLRELPRDLAAPICGFMTMAPFGVPEQELEQVFGGLRQLRDQCQDELGIALPHLSMGMSADYSLAIKHGATIVRIGTAIFGRR